MLKWTDVNDIAIELMESHPDVDPQYVHFVDLTELGDGAGRFLG